MNLKTLFKKITASLILFFCVFATALEAPYVHSSYLRGLGEKNTVKIVGREGMGTGFHVKAASGKVYILTNKHICSMTGPLKIFQYGDENGYVRNIVKISKDHDLCLIEALPGKSGLSLGSAAENGDTVYTLGHPRGDALTIANGEKIDNKDIQMQAELEADGSCDGTLVPQEFFGIKIGDVCVKEEAAIQISTPTYPGNSGSPVVNKYGHVVGIIFAGNQSIENMGFYVPLSFVKLLLSEY